MNSTKEEQMSSMATRRESLDSCSSCKDDRSEEKQTERDLSLQAQWRSSYLFFQCLRTDQIFLRGCQTQFNDLLLFKLEKRRGTKSECCCCCCHSRLDACASLLRRSDFEEIDDWSISSCCPVMRQRIRMTFVSSIELLWVRQVSVDWYCHNSDFRNRSSCNNRLKTGSSRWENNSEERKSVCTNSLELFPSKRPVKENSTEFDLRPKVPTDRFDHKDSE